MSIVTNNSFKCPVVGVDPITKGTFTIEYAYMIWDDPLEYDEEGWGTKLSRAQGKIVITSENDNPLYKIAKESPLRLQGLVASVNFGIEKRFIKIGSIGDYGIYPKMNGIEQINLNPVTFEILDNLEYMENIIEYKDQNLL
jgi:hypothetical protein